MLWRILVGLALALGITWGAVQRESLDAAAIARMLEAMAVPMPLGFVAVYAVAAVLFVPGSALTIAAGAIFGPLAGALWSLSGATLGAVFAFLLARTLLGEWVRGRVGGRLGELVDGVEAEGWRFVAFVRLVPLFPYNLLNYALGLTRIRLVPYAAATFVFMAPGAFAYGYLGYAGREVVTRSDRALQVGLWALALLAAVALLPSLARRWRRRSAIDPAELRRELERSSDVVVLDVRTRAELCGPLGVIRGSIPIPIDELPGRLPELDAWRSRLLVPV